MTPGTAAVEGMEVSDDALLVGAGLAALLVVWLLWRA